MAMSINLPKRYLVTERPTRKSLSVLVRATDLEHNRSVVVKMLPRSRWMQSSEARQRTLDTVSCLMPLIDFRHPNASGIHDVYEYGNTPLLVREPVHALSVRQHLHRNGTLPLHVIRRITDQIADVLDRLGAAGKTHGGVHIDNVFITETGDAVVTDAGWSAAVRRYRLAGRTCRLIRRSHCPTDIGALAGLVYTALVGVDAYRDNGDIHRAYTAPGSLREAIARAMLSPDGGFESATQFAEALRPRAKKSIVHTVLRPAAATGLLMGLAMMGPSALPNGPAPARPVPTEATASVTPDSAANTYKLLSAEDRQVLELAFRRQGAATLLAPSVAQIFMLTDTQISLIRDCLRWQREQIDAIVTRTAAGQLSDSRATMSTIRETTNARVARLLTPDQRALWLTLNKATPKPGEPYL